MGIVGIVGGRSIGVVTVGRSDYTGYVPILHRLQSDGTCRLRLIVAGAHLAEASGRTISQIERDGFAVAETVDVSPAADSPLGLADALGRGVTAFANLFARHAPDILLLFGDRYEMYAAALAALPFRIPIAHIHGGELTEGAIDDALRHSLTKLSHLHFASTEEYANRIVQLGEEPWRVSVTGAPALDALHSLALMSAEALAREAKLHVTRPFLLATYHPVTLEYETTKWQAREFLAALDWIGLPVLFTMPNADMGSGQVVDAIHEFLGAHPASQLVTNLGPRGYFSAMALSQAVVGNSSSGIIEAASLRVPVVNVGNRQKGRMRPRNVIDVGPTHEEVAAGIQRAIEPAFRSGLADLENPYGSGAASERIVQVLTSVELGDRLVLKHFHDLPRYRTPMEEAPSRGGSTVSTR